MAVPADACVAALAGADGHVEDVVRIESPQVLRSAPTFTARRRVASQSLWKG